ncbi:D-ornithine 4,5-aminomutase S subunit [Thermoanaerobacter uzonensis DSM 18761]|jgi:D-ornithine 4,5-aminomutase subunit alpha|uniref:D-ornithine 4,5-aminomutase S subunit n=1 Tax=Thermoanaerobacter uzonensis DSM 18761 TaxID=1123369 RepID=A0A1M4VCP0_9THEO|nr:ornithine aminomutase subunit alpha [Thermoanaerobacter uzonensis]SHE66752.1 D-ornithine 4,5-aminomutase S subunit [Thermoanaerobacter uzonensis DSM 18761]
MRREDDFETRSEHLKHMTDEELDAYFWKLAEKIVDPLIELAYYHTSPSIERSVLLRMGFSSIEAKEIVNRIEERGLLPKGAGSIVLKVAERVKKDYLTAGKSIANGEYLEVLDDIAREASKNEA